MDLPRRWYARNVLGVTAPIARHARPLIDDALSDTRAVVIVGARQVGKSTLAQQLADDHGFASVETLDDAATRQAALRDPTGFIADRRLPVVIDEIQRAPELLLAIKQHVDRDQSPGQFLLTGSANLLTAPRVADALPGRAAYVTLHPFSQGELARRRERFLEQLLGGEIPQLSQQPTGRRAYAHAIAAGGYPEAVRRSGASRARFFDGYLSTLLGRDIPDLASITDRTAVGRLLEAVAAVSGSELNADGLSRRLGISASTVRSYVDLLETSFLIHRLPPWSGNRFARAVKAPKAYISDAGMLLDLLGADSEQLVRDDGLAASAFETFAAMEILKQASWAPRPLRIYHYRDRDQREVDLVIEQRDGTIVAVEIKASATVGTKEARGLRYLRDRVGERFAAGAVLYTGASTVPLDDRIAAVPLSALWTGEEARLRWPGSRHGAWWAAGRMCSGSSAPNPAGVTAFRLTCRRSRRLRG